MKYVDDYVKFNEKAWNHFIEANYQSPKYREKKHARS